MYVRPRSARCCVGCPWPRSDRSWRWQARLKPSERHSRSAPVTYSRSAFHLLVVGRCPGWVVVVAASTARCPAIVARRRRIHFSSSTVQNTSDLAAIPSARSAADSATVVKNRCRKRYLLRAWSLLLSNEAAGWRYVYLPPANDLYYARLPLG